MTLADIAGGSVRSLGGCLFEDNAAARLFLYFVNLSAKRTKTRISIILLSFATLLHFGQDDYANNDDEEASLLHMRPS